MFLFLKGVALNARQILFFYVLHLLVVELLMCPFDVAKNDF